MKKNNIASIAFLVLAGLAAIWFEWRDQSPQTRTKEQQQSVNTDGYILAVSWQAAFCEKRPNRAECRSQRSGRFDASNFSLHGLWPQPRTNLYCNVSDSEKALDKSGRWGQLPKLDLSDELRKELSEKMPGYRSYLHRHEWAKHGTCIPGITPQAYFQASLKLLDSLNASAIAQLFRDNINQNLNYRELDQAFARSFGRGAGKRLVADCYRDDGRHIFSELKLSLSGEIIPKPQLGELIASGAILGSSCPSGRVDPVGLQ